MFCWVGAGRIERKLNNVGGELKSPIGMKNRDESQESKVEELNPAILLLFFFYVYDDMVRGEQCSFAMLLYYLLFFFRGRPNPFKIL